MKEIIGRKIEILKYRTEHRNYIRVSWRPQDRNHKRSGSFSWRFSSSWLFPVASSCLLNSWQSVGIHKQIWLSWFLQRLSFMCLALINWIHSSDLLMEKGWVAAPCSSCSVAVESFDHILFPKSTKKTVSHEASFKNLWWFSLPES